MVTASGLVGGGYRSTRMCRALTGCGGRRRALPSRRRPLYAGLTRDIKEKIAYGSHAFPAHASACHKVSQSAFDGEPDIFPKGNRLTAGKDGFALVREPRFSCRSARHFQYAHKKRPRVEGGAYLKPETGLEEGTSSVPKGRRRNGTLAMRVR